MFSLFKSHPGNGEAGLTRVRRSVDPVTRNQHIACKACHAKKVRCSGESEGCARCKAKSVMCEYAPHLPRGRSRRIRTGARPVKETTTIRSPTESKSPVQDSDLTSPNDQPYWSPTIDSDALDQFHLEIGNDQPYWDPTIASDSLDEAHLEIGNDYSLSGSVWPDLLHEQFYERSPNASNTKDLDMVDLLNIPSDVVYRSHDSANPQMSPPDVDRNVSSQIVANTQTHNTTPSDDQRDCLVDSSLSSPTVEDRMPPLSQTGTSTSYQCDCVHGGVSVLEALQLTSPEISGSAFDRQLYVKKSAIDKCLSLMSCPSCKDTSVLVVLLATICEKIVTSFEAWSQKYVDYSTSNEASLDTPSMPVVQTENGTFGEYLVDHDDEKCSMIRALAVVQLKRLCVMIGRLSVVAESNNFGAHKSILASYIGRAEAASQSLIGRF